MSQIAMVRPDGQQTSVDISAITHLGETLHGEIITPRSENYTSARSLWNAMIDRYPVFIVRCKEPDDICQAVRFANEHGVLMSVRSGGHNVAGSACCHGGMMIDLSTMKMVKIDPQTATAMANPGATLGEYDAVTQQEGLATPLGINSTTGIAGLTLGGGFGWISRKYGLTIDNLRSARVVTAEGKLITANAMDNPDLLWALKGGGGNFGIVASFTLKVHEIGKEVFSGLIVHPFDDAPDALRFYREFCKTLPDEVAVWSVIRKAPAMPFIPQEWHGKKVLIFAACAVGNQAMAQEALAPLRAYGKPIVDVIGPHSYVAWQKGFDPLLSPVARNYWKSHYLQDLKDEVIDALLESVEGMTSDHCEILIAQMGGAISRVADDATAYGNRSANFIVNIHGRWDTMEMDKPGITWCRSVFDAITPYATGGVYVNFMSMEEGARVEKAYGANFQRLKELKKKWDPNNLFRLNQNIKPD